MQIVGDVTDTSRQKSTNVFYIKDGEYYNLDQGRLRYNPDCKLGSAGLLEIMVNSHQIFLGVPDCGTLNQVPIPPSFLNKGENIITFSTDDGSYLIDMIEVRNDIKEIEYPVYYFDLDDDDIDALISGDATVAATFEFVKKYNNFVTYKDDYNNYTNKYTDIQIERIKRMMETKEPFDNYAFNIFK